MPLDVIITQTRTMSVGSPWPNLFHNRFMYYIEHIYTNKQSKCIYRLRRKEAFTKYTALYSYIDKCHVFVADKYIYRCFSFHTHIFKQILIMGDIIR